MPRVDNQGVSIHYRVEGDGPPVVIGHGITDSSETWYERGYVAALQAKYRLVFIDTRGHGQSDKPHDPSSYALEKCASDVVAVLDDLGMKTAAYWGYSMGGRIGYALARHALDRVTCFVVGGAAASGASPYPADSGKEPPLITGLRAGPEAVIKIWGEEWVTPALRKRLLANDTAALIACAQRPQTTEKYSDVVGKITAPTFVYAGSADPVHDAARQGASEISGAQFVSLPGLNHPAANLRSDLVLPHVEPFLAKALGH
jgi:pimeloyl-ACP methyl ester carboxylesterase